MLDKGGPGKWWGCLQGSNQRLAPDVLIFLCQTPTEVTFRLHKGIPSDMVVLSAHGNLMG